MKIKDLISYLRGVVATNPVAYVWLVYDASGKPKAVYVEDKAGEQ